METTTETKKIKLEGSFEQLTVKSGSPTKAVFIIIGGEQYAPELKSLEEKRLKLVIEQMQATLAFDEDDERKHLYDRGYDDGWNAGIAYERDRLGKRNGLMINRLSEEVEGTLTYKGKTVDLGTGEVLSEVIKDAHAELEVTDDAEPSPEPPAEAEASESQAEVQETTEWSMLSPEHIGSVLVRQGMSAEESPRLIITGCTPSGAVIAWSDEGAERFIDESEFGQFWALLQDEQAEEAAPIPFSEKLEAGDRIRSKPGAEIVEGRPSRALVIKVLAKAVQTDKGLVPKKVIDEKYELEVDGRDG